MQKLQAAQESGEVKYYKSYYITNTIAVSSKKDMINEIEQLDNVEEISSNRKFLVKGSNSNVNNEAIVLNEVNWTGDTSHWSIDYINASNISNSARRNAAELRYANADTGVQYDHPALVSNYLGALPDGTFDHNYFWWDANKKANSSRPNSKCGINSPVPCGDDDHGTHTMSTVVGSLNLGISPTTKWMACKNMDNNFGSPESYLGCLQFFLAPTKLDGTDPKPELRPHVIGNSYTCPPSEGCSSTTFQYALKALKMAGILMSVSAGNSGADGCGSIQYPPAIDPNSFTVGALNYNSDGRAYFSSMGPVPSRINLSGLDIMAPGVNITGAALGSSYKSLAGTSMASPHVSGAALLIMAACPHLERKVDEVEILIRKTATPLYSKLGCGGDIGTTYPNNEFGYGKINVGKAIEMCQSS
ncbi:subtilisin-like protein [Neoconidiobolus thromboides FSU 785]|nr:subtilisin-like protein [Neoconidiobolus thromboides FSU 785]